LQCPLEAAFDSSESAVLFDLHEQPDCPALQEILAVEAIQGEEALELPVVE
jgi:hypothetical protein